MARAAGDGAGARGRRARAHGVPRDWLLPRACPIPTVLTSPRSPSRRATPPTATRELFASHAAEEVDRHQRAGGLQQHAGHGRRAAPPVPRAGAAVVRAGQGAVVDHQLDRADRARADRRVRRRRPGRAQRRLLPPPSRCSPSPAASASTSSRRSTIREFLMSDPPQVFGILAPIVDARREVARGRPHQRAGRGRVHRRGRRLAPPVRRRDPVVRHAAARGRLGHDVEADGHHPRRPPRASRRAGGGAGRPAARCGRRSRSRCAGSRPTRCSRDWVTADTEFFGVHAARRAPCCTSASARRTATRRGGSDPTSSTSRVRSKPSLALRRRPPHLPRACTSPGPR